MMICFCAEVDPIIGSFDHYTKKAVYEPLVGMAAFMSTDAARPRGLVTVEALTIESKVVVTGELIGTSGNAGLVCE